MSELSAEEQVALYSLGDPDQEGGGNLGLLLAALGPPYQETRRNYYIAGLAVPSEAELRDTLQRLRERGYLEAMGCEICGVTTVGDLHDAEIDQWETDLTATPSGVAAALPFRRLIESEEGRRMAADFVRRYIDEQRASLPFEAVVPSWMLADEAFLSELEVGDDDLFSLQYRRGPDWIVIEQSSNDIQDEFVGPNSEPLSARSQTLHGVELSLREYQLTSIWARLIANWTLGQIYCRIVIERNHDVGAYPEWKPAAIDDSIREEALKIAQSMIEQVEN